MEEGEVVERRVKGEDGEVGKVNESVYVERWKERR